MRSSSTARQLSLIERAALRLPKLALARTRDYRLSTSFGLGLGRRAERTPFSSEFRLYAGSYWNIIRRECAETLIDFVDENPDIVDYFRQVILPDESFVQTIEQRRGSPFALRPAVLRFQRLASWPFENAERNRSSGGIREQMLFCTQVRRGYAPGYLGPFGPQGPRVARKGSSQWRAYEHEAEPADQLR
ncbi:MAG TPA: hypothetical protein VF014_01600 [Casimicrobiaceae bacterium]|nr:hypothetical protein [Casimicrobiaceae bacterium]